MLQPTTLHWLGVGTWSTIRVAWATVLSFTARAVWSIPRARYNVQANQGGLHRLCITNAASPYPISVYTNFTLTVLPDTDTDGLPDDWESACGIDPVSGSGHRQRIYRLATPWRP